MIRVDFKKSINFLLITLSSMIVGCSDAPKENLNLSYQTPIIPVETDTGINQQNLFKHKLKKTASNHKDTVWERLLSLYSLPEANHPRIDREVNWYLEHPTSLAILQQRAEPYLAHILDEIEAKNIPGELALLPVVESAFVPDAYSKADASGLWQFVPSTGKEYGLMQTDWYDGRRDILDSTKAATTYLKELNEDFNGDWLLALASYNCGKGRVRKSIDKNTDLNLPTDYWSLDLPEETDDYVPRLLAIAKIFANADEYKIHLQHIPNKPYFEVVNIHSPLDLDKAAQLANLPQHKFLKLNPGFNRDSTSPHGPHRLLVPVTHAQAFKQNLALLPFSERVSYKRYDEDNVIEPRTTDKHLATTTLDPQKTTKPQITFYKVKQGDKLTSIAKNYATTTAALRLSNYLSNDTIRAGMTLQIAKNVKTSLAISDKTPKTNELTAVTKTTKVTNIALLDKPTKAKPFNSLAYEIKKGDTFYNISQRFSVAPQEIASWNNISLKSALLPGKKITIKATTQHLASSNTPHLMNYTVVKNDSLEQISKKFKVSVADLRKANPTVLAKGLNPGQRLKVLIDSTPYSG